MADHSSTAEQAEVVEAIVETQEMSLREILTRYQDGDGIGWPAEFAWLRTFHAKQIAELTISFSREGFNLPILLGYDGRVWDGHHRLCVAEALGWGHLDVQLCEKEEGE